MTLIFVLFGSIVFMCLITAISERIWPETKKTSWEILEEEARNDEWRR